MMRDRELWFFLALVLAAAVWLVYLVAAQFGRSSN